MKMIEKMKLCFSNDMNFIGLVKENSYYIDEILDNGGWTFYLDDLYKLLEACKDEEILDLIEKIGD
jgi:hypothetical protein